MVQNLNLQEVNDHGSSEFHNADNETRKGLEYFLQVQECVRFQVKSTTRTRKCEWVAGKKLVQFLKVVIPKKLSG